MEYVVARGSIKLPTKLPEGAKKTAVPRPKFINQDELVPEGMLSEDEITSLLAEGRIVPLREGSKKAQEAVRARRQRRGKWAVDPKTLEGKTMEELTMLILGIDEKYDVGSLKSLDQARAQLTKDWDPTFKDDISRGFDTNTPGLTPDGVKDGEIGELSDKSQQALQRAKDRANRQRPS